MGLWRDEPDSGGIAAHVTRVAEGLAKLLTEHLTLARLEVTQDAKALARQAALVAIFVPFILTGYGLLCVALAFWLARWMPTSAAFAVVGGVNVVGGGIGVWRATRRLQERPLLDETVSELGRSAALLKKDKMPSEEVHGQQ
jgi:uncharacterized membrane protein YqjE